VTTTIGVVSETRPVALCRDKPISSSGAGDQYLPGAVRDPARAQPGAHGAADGGGQQAEAGPGGQHGAVLRDDRVDMIQSTRENSLQLAR